jgi:hypothetical protein
MSEILFQYHQVHLSTWIYLSSLLMIGLFFKFNRFWSVRNLDLVLLIAISPGLLLVQYGSDIRQENHVEMSDVAEVFQGTARSFPPSVDRAIAVERLGYCWCFVIGGLLLGRLLIDPTMVRRPLLEPNLTTGGLAFIGCSLFLFLMANVVTNRTAAIDPSVSDRGDVAVHAAANSAEVPSAEVVLPTVVAASPDSTPEVSDLRRHGPGYAVLRLAIRKIAEGNRTPYVVAGKTVAILSHLAVVLGLVLIGYRQFENTRTGIGVATLYLMMPYTAIATGRIDHVVPAALLVWAILSYRRPVWAGLFIGLAAGIVYYPFFLLPLWASFYWRRGLRRFMLSFGSMLILLVVAQFFMSSDWTSFRGSLVEMFGIWLPRYENLEGIWGLGWSPVYRLPVLVLFLALSGTLAIWPAQKNLGTLIGCSAAVMLATQFWHGYGGGIFVGWYLPLLLLTIFRPNLEDRVAVTVLGDSWWFKRLARDHWLAQPRRHRQPGKRDVQTHRHNTRRKSGSSQVR